VDDITWASDPQLDTPIVIAAFEGWNDAGDAASTAVRRLAEHCGATPLGEISSEPFTDFAVNRPIVRLGDDGSRIIEWPATKISHGRLPDDQRDVVFIEGSEPRLRWRPFADVLVGLVRDLDASMVVTFGALLADVVHSDPIKVIGSAIDPDLVSRLALRRSTYEGPTGIVGVLQAAITDAEIDAVSLWAPVPAYVSAAPSPKAALALLESASQLFDLHLDMPDLQAAAAGYEQKVDELVEGDDDLMEYVERIREAAAEEPLTDDPERSSDELVAELERYLRDQTRGD
jgi:proteasome assembly chaperone (PAC2) family protein